MNKADVKRPVVLAFALALVLVGQGCEEKKLAEPPAAVKALEMAAPVSGGDSAGAGAADREGRPAEGAK